ncbi:MAG: alpha/beta hydrolase family protein [Jiangellaceae bacterium]
MVVATPVGDAGLIVDVASGSALGTVVLGHGAGGGIRARDLVALAGSLPESGITVVRVVQPWLLAGRRVAPAARTLDRAWLAVLETVQRDGPLAVGGRSAGARVACRTARAVGAVGVVALAFPLHPPGRPERSRWDELAGAGVPTLVVQGDHDAFGRPAEFPPGEHELVVVPHADHGMAVPKSQDQAAALDRVVTTVTGWLGNVLAHSAR